jgi:hypothetical protein
MDQNTEAAPGGSEPIDVPAFIPAREHKAGGDGPLNPREAARSITDWRRKTAAGEEQQEESAPAATPVTESEPQGEDAAPPQEATGETQEADPAELPPLDLPRSWTKEQAEHWKALPRATQEYLIERASKDSEAVRRSQNEAAEHRKAIEAERAQVEQAKLQYEAALPHVFDHLQRAYEGQFSDIKTMADVQKLATEDPIRYSQWDAHQKQMAAFQQEIASAQQRNAYEAQQRLTAFMQRESEKLAEKLPELSNPETANKLRTSAVGVLRDLGFSNEELDSLWRGREGLTVHDHRFQLLLIDGIKYREAQQKVRDIPKQAKPIPPVQRPGASPGKGAQREALLKDLQHKADSASGINALRLRAQLVTARRKG